jgi:cobaltochelatase CobN
LPAFSETGFSQADLQMHLIKIEQSGELYADGEAVDLGQSPGAAVILTAADTEISCLAAATRHSGRATDQVRLASLLSLSHPHSIDLYIESVLAHAKVIVVRLLGGVSYWTYGAEQLAQLARSKNIPAAFLPGDGKPDPELDRLSTLPTEDLARLNAYLIEGGLGNAESFLDALDDIINDTSSALPPKPFLPAGIYWPEVAGCDLDRLKTIWAERGLAADAPVSALVFYRALNQSGDTAPVDAMITAMIDQGLAPLPVFVASLKDAFCADLLRQLLAEASASVILNMTGFAVTDPSALRDSSRSPGPFGAVDCPVLQVMLASNTAANWGDGTAGLNPRDLAMNVVLPELDGRLITRAVGFKTRPRRDDLTEAMVTGYEAHPERCRFVAEMARRWTVLGKLPKDRKKLGLIMANYPNKDGRLANGVGLDTPQSVAVLLHHLAQEGYYTENLPASGREVIADMMAAPTNSGIEGRKVEAWFGFDEYAKAFSTLPEAVRDTITERWGRPEDDPMAAPGGFAMPARLYGHIALAVQPARGYNIDPKASYHSPDLPPPHNYLAFYFWLRFEFGADAVIHMGKHGNLEWLPGKSLALSDTCMPDAVLGPMPHLYPFIVNDPGEGAQAKRRIQAVVLDHLTPPMTLADSHGVMVELEALMDEYYEAVGLDGRRTDALMESILMTADRAGLAADSGILPDDDDDEKLLKLDNFLCDLKEMQIRDGLHVFGKSPEGRLFDDLLTAILRIPRGDGEGPRASILRSLARDLGMEGFDPLTAERAMPWNGKRPDILAKIDDAPWRHHGDTAERLNRLASMLVAGEVKPDPAWAKTCLILDEELPQIAAAIRQSGEDEMFYILKALDGGYVPAAPSGAPTRGRPEVLPTGRNFFSIDSRSLPTEVAWRIGWTSACSLIDRYLQDHGDYPQSLVLSAWGTSNMRTGGDDIAQAMALMGVQPQWDSASRRVTGFDVLPLSVLGRPRIDVTVRCSGFFRDAFPSQIALLDKVARTVGALEEPAGQNPIAAKMKAEAEAMIAGGADEKEAVFMAGFRVFSSKPGAYGAGLQTLIDEGIWSEREDFGEAFLTWSSYAYGAEGEGLADRAGLERRLQSVNGIIHNQDNREHDILDSDDYYQFAGGLSAAVASLGGGDVPVYMGDHALPEAPRIRSLKEEITRIVRGRATNPKWIAGVMRHDYKGAFEMAATLDYLFAFSATTRQVPSHLFDHLFEAWIEKKDVYDFLADANPEALKDMMARFDEAIDRGLWQPHRNSIIERLEQFKENAQNNDEKPGLEFEGEGSIR